MLRDMKESSGSLVFSQGQNLYLYTTLDSSAGLASFDTTPAGAEIFMGTCNPLLEVTPYNMDGLALDTHTVLLQAKGYAAAFRKMDNQDGEKESSKPSSPSLVPMSPYPPTAVMPL